jgi:hypothetical protein
MDLAEQVRDAVEARALLVVRSDDVPRRVLGVGGRKHPVARPRVLVPLLARRQIHRAQFPLADRIVDAVLEPAALLLVAHFHPVLEQDDAAIGDVLLDLGAERKESLVLLLRAESHDVFDARPVVPAAIEDHHFAVGGEVRHVPLHVHLRLLAVRWRGQRHHAKHARAHALGDRADGAALAGSIAAFEQNDDAQTFLLHPGLQVAEFHLQLVELFLVDLPLQLLARVRTGIALFGHRHSFGGGGGAKLPPSAR